MSNLVIVAIPSEDDFVHKISSEQVPHLTLLFLGEESGQPTQKIVEFVQHAVSLWERGSIFLDVDHRGKLGDADADVLFFQRDWSLKELDFFRGQLLQEHNIRTAYESASQHTVIQDWIPHLTLGYPEKPAKPDNRDYPGISYVRFDRIAVWTDNYAGPEFRLNYNHDDLEEAVRMSTTSERGAEFLEHFGVKGMKWGVRKDRAPQAATATSRTNAGLRGKTKVKAEGGKAQPASDDAIKVAMKKQIMRKSGTAALSNQDLADLAQRMRLEVEVTRLDTETQSSGKKFVKKALGQNVQRVSQQETAAAVDRAVKAGKIKRAARVAAAVA